MVLPSGLSARYPALLRSFITDRVPRYAELRAPTVIITGERDTMVSPDINARTLAATLPRARLVLLKDIGQMPHHGAPDIVAAAVDELAARSSSRLANARLIGNDVAAWRIGGRANDRTLATGSELNEIVK